MKILYYLGWKLTRIISKFLFRVRVTGVENVPTSGGFILASNHTSYFDPPLVGCWIKRPLYFFAKKELFRNPLFGAILRRVNALPVKRGVIDRHALQLAVETIKKGNGLTVFPEGTRSRDGKLRSPKPGIGMIARHAECPIVPAFLSGSNTLWKCFVGKAKLTVTYGAPLPAEWVTSFPRDKEGYQNIARGIMEHIGKLAPPTADSDASPAVENVGENRKNLKKSP